MNRQITINSKPCTIPSFFMWGVLLVGFGFLTYLSAVLLAFVRAVTNINDPMVRSLLEGMMWYGGSPVIVGLLLIFTDLAFFLRRRKLGGTPMFAPLSNSRVTVLLTSWNDQESIGTAVEDFISHPAVARVIVVDNNSSDDSRAVAQSRGAQVVNETAPGYGNCVYRALREGIACQDTDLTVICEGDMTFRARDLEKLLAYIPHAEIVNGTRIVEQLREPVTQLTTFMYYGNFAVGKLLEAKYLGRGTFTDVGTTYKLCRNSALKRLLPSLNREVNLEFNAHFLDTALSLGERIVECPITFYQRVGESKGGNIDNLRALKVGARMIIGILLGWPPVPRSVEGQGRTIS